MAASSIGAQMGIIASPVSVAVVSLVAMLGNVTFDGKHLEFLDLLSITIPSTLLGIRQSVFLVGSAVKIWIKTKRFRNLFPYRKTVSTCTAIPRRCWIKTAEKQLAGDVDLPAAIAVVALTGADSDLRPTFGGKPLSMVLVIQMFMLLTGALIIILTKTNPASISKTKFFVPV